MKKRPFPFSTTTGRQSTMSISTKSPIGAFSMLPIVQMMTIMTLSLSHPFHPLLVMASPSSSSSSLLHQQNNITLAMVSGDSAFFDPVQVGWETACDALGQNVNCIYVEPNWTAFYEQQQDKDYAHPCIPLMNQLIDMGVDGLAAKCVFEDGIEAWERASALDIPLVAFDGLPPNDFPVALDAYVGTDQSFMGRTMARLLKQLRPEGGTFGLVYRPEQLDRVIAFRNELMMDNDREDLANWYEIQPVHPDHPDESDDDGHDLIWDPHHDHSMEIMNRLSAQNPTSIIFMYQTPMRSGEKYTKFIDANRNKNITFIGTDGSDYQLDYLTRRYVDGLVGQLPYDMGYFSAEKLLQLAEERFEQVIDRHNQSHALTDGEDTAQLGAADNTVSKDVPHEIEIIPTNLVAYNLIPTELPPLDLEENLLGNLVYIGFTCFGVLTTCSLACVAWTVWNRKAPVVRASQPLFLTMLAIGVILMACALIPLSYDDNGEPSEMTSTKAVGICMSIPWLSFVGFTVAFSALFAKTWRINKLVHSASSFGRVKVSEMDVLKPFMVLLTLNIAILACWTVIDPLQYKRHFLRGTDFWNREYESIGTCDGEHAVAFLTPLAIVNFGVVVTACYQAWQARDITSEFSEAKYIGLAVFSMCQAFLTGIPIVAIVRNIPEAFYLVLTFLIFILCMVLMLLIFLPKMLMHRSYSRMSESEQKKMIQKSLRASSVQHSASRSCGNIQMKSSQALNFPSQVSGLSTNDLGLNHLKPLDASMSQNSSGRNRSVRFSVADSISMTVNSGIRRSVDMENIDEEDGSISSFKDNDVVDKEDEEEEMGGEELTDSSDSASPTDT